MWEGARRADTRTGRWSPARNETGRWSRDLFDDGIRPACSIGCAGTGRYSLGGTGGPVPWREPLSEQSGENAKNHYRQKNRLTPTDTSRPIQATHKRPQKVTRLRHRRPPTSDKVTCPPATCQQSNATSIPTTSRPCPNCETEEVGLFHVEQFGKTEHREWGRGRNVPRGTLGET